MAISIDDVVRIQAMKIIEPSMAWQLLAAELCKPLIPVINGQNRTFICDCITAT
jgi:hypothetical protein